jgi:crotonobetainyl-CoA:carnitine CoA-transferase CaiB-like acyl-CoA transferase
LENHDQLLSKIESKTKEYESDVLLEELLEEGIPAGKLQPVEDAIQNEQLKHRDMIKTVEDTDGKSVNISGNPIKIDGESTDIQREPPKKGEHTREILSQVGFDRTDIDKFISKDVVESN